MKKTNISLTLLVLYSSICFGRDHIPLLNIKNFNLDYAYEKGAIDFESITIDSKKVKVKNLLSRFLFKRSSNDLYLTTGNWKILFTDFYLDLLSQIRQANIVDGSFIFIPGKKIFLNFEKGSLNNTIYPKLLFSCEQNNSLIANKRFKALKNDFYYFLKPCLAKGLFQIPQYNLKKKKKLKSLIPSRWKNISLRIFKNQFNLYAKSANGLRGKLKIKGLINYQKKSSKMIIKLSKARFGILSIKKRIQKLILANIPNSTIENGNIVISL